MAATRDEVISTLNDLIETCKDGEQGFLTCAADVGRLELKEMFEKAALRCAEAARELQMEVQRLGGTPERSGSFAGSVHRRWVDVRSAITGQSEAQVLAECERGEDVAKESYQNALAKDLPVDIRAIVERQYRGVLQHHDAVRSLERMANARS